MRYILKLSKILFVLTSICVISLPSNATLGGEKQGCYALCRVVTLDFSYFERKDVNRYRIVYRVVPVSSTDKESKGEALQDLIDQCDSLIAQSYEQYAEIQPTALSHNLEIKGSYSYDEPQAYGTIEEFASAYRLRLFQSVSPDLVDFNPSQACL